MDLNKPATVKQVMLIVWGPAIVLMAIWAVVMVVAANNAKRQRDAALPREWSRRDAEAQRVLDETAKYMPENKQP